MKNLNRVLLWEISRSNALNGFRGVLAACMIICDLWISYWGLGFWSGWLQQTLRRLATMTYESTDDDFLTSNIMNDFIPIPSKALTPVEKLVRPSIKSRKTNIQLLETDNYVPRRSTRIKKAPAFYSS